MTENKRHNKPNRTNLDYKSTARNRYIDLGDTRRESLGEWLYNHRIGLIVSFLSLLVGGTALATMRYNVEVRPIEYLIEFVEETPSVEEIEKLRRQRDQLQEDIERRMAAIQQVQNLQSNEAADMAGGAEQMSYDKDVQQLMDKVASDMATNNDAYNSGLKEVSGMGKGGSGEGSGGAKGDGERGKFSGAVTVSYNFTDPVRHHRDLYVPAYRAKGGGIVVVDVWIDRNGTVTNAHIASSTNSELNEQALAAARNRRTLFRIDGTAPSPQRGTITYTFVAQ